jgi:ribosomal protein L16/L10AE
MLQPKQTKYRKQQKSRNRGLASRGNKVSFGEFALKAMARGHLTARQLEAARRTISRYVKRGGKLWIRIFPDKPITNGYCTRWKALLKRWRVRHFDWRLPSFLSRLCLRAEHTYDTGQ